MEHFSSWDGGTACRSAASAGAPAVAAAGMLASTETCSDDDDDHVCWEPADPLIKENADSSCTLTTLKYCVSKGLVKRYVHLL